MVWLKYAALLLIIGHFAPTYSVEITIAQEHKNIKPFALVVRIIERSIADFGSGNDQLKWVDVTHMNQKRLVAELKSCKAPFDLLFTGYSKYRERELIQLSVPLTQGLLGVRGFVVNAEQLQRYQTNSELITGGVIGSGRGWPDTEIMKYNGYKVAESDYLNLWTMLKAQRFDAFQRGAQEAQLELLIQNQLGSQFELMNNLLMIYPLDFFLYVNPCKPELASNLEKSLKAAINTGLIRQLIEQDEYSQVVVQMLQDEKVKKVILKNPSVSAETLDLYWRYSLDEIKNSWLDNAKRMLQKGR